MTVRSAQKHRTALFQTGHRFPGIIIAGDHAAAILIALHRLLIKCGKKCIFICFNVKTLCKLRKQPDPCVQI